jgi:hypothetical protein
MLESRGDVVGIIDRIVQLFTQVSSGPPAPLEVTFNHRGEVHAVNEQAKQRIEVDPFLVLQLTSLLPRSMKDVVQRALLRFLR